MTDLKQELSLTLEDYYRLSLSVRNRRRGGQRWLSYIFFSVVFYSVWRWTLLVIGLDKLIWFIGCFIFGWQSPFMKIIRHAAQNQALVSLFVHAKNIVSQPCNSTLMKVTKHDHECMQRYYQFKVIEHQRWWLHKGWSSFLLKNERPSWSDEYLEKVPCIQEFRLPPPVTKSTETFRWEWVTEEWQVDQQRNVDQEGWEYGIWGWNAWTSQSSGLRSYTRRRHWTRNARLIVETKVEDDVVQPELEALSADKETISSAPISVTTGYFRPSSSNSTVSSTFTVPSLLSTSFSTISSEEEEPLSPTVSTSLDHGNGFLYTKPLSISSSTPTTERFEHHQRKVKRSFSEHSSMETHFWLHR
ncbi:MAG: integral peroxisomal membrane peroxin-domain-containing protein [Benjaminiella poitrasii]|nr:MAG: integral peroxisomal membrane peroxin-domain-containing protein [Benjaminiella poitrasii]